MGFSVEDIINDPDFKTEFMLTNCAGVMSADGKWTVTETVVSNVFGIILPAKLSDLETLPEGERNKDTIKCYTNHVLTMGDQQAAQADLIFYLGNYYRIAALKYYAQVNVYMALGTLFQRRP